MRLLVYALGGGLGHLQRSLALGRGAVRRGHECVVLTNSPAWPRIAGRFALEGIRVEHFAGHDREVANAAGSWLRRDGTGALVVDTFPRGIVGELADGLPGVPRILVHRDLTTDYAGRADVVESVRRFDLVLCPGERGPFEHQNLVTTAPWVLLEPEELLDRKAARAELGCRDDRPLVIVCDATDAGEAAGLAAVARALRVRFGERARVLSVTFEDTWPLLRLHLGIDLLVGSAGYNTVHECRLLGTPLRAIPRERLYDRQHRRLEPSEWLEDLEVPVPPLRRAATVPFTNGVHAAIEAIEGAVTTGM